MRTALRLMRESVDTGTIVDRPDLLAGIEDITSLVGYDKIETLEAQFLNEDQLRRKYGGEAPSYVVPEHPPHASRPLEN